MRGISSALALVALLSATGCNPTKSQRDPTSGGRQVSVRDIAVAMPNPDDPWRKLQLEYMNLAAKEVGSTIHLVTVNGASNALVKEAVGAASATRSTGLIIESPLEEAGLIIRDDTERFGIPTMAINTRLRDAESKRYLDMPFFGVNNRDLGAFAANGAINEATKRGWKSSETGVIISMTSDGAKLQQRGSAMKETFIASGYSASQIQSQASDFKKYKNWLIVGGADAPVLSAVRASEAAGVPAQQVIGVSIGGLGALDELNKPSGYYAAVLIGPKAHAYDVFKRVVNAIKNGLAIDPIPTFNNGVWLTRDNLAKETKEQMLDKLPDYAKSIQP
ncbi:MAG: hypothetical protein JNK63_06745 [Chthonomonas sp.]|nr:hypothetical protein [Chthonomonas sp.]